MSDGRKVGVSCRCFLTSVMPTTSSNQLRPRRRTAVDVGTLKQSITGARTCTSHPRIPLRLQPRPFPTSFETRSPFLASENDSHDRWVIFAANHHTPLRRTCNKSMPLASGSPSCCAWRTDSETWGRHPHMSEL
eukprot:3702817-Rhodomonas_salina.1